MKKYLISAVFLLLASMAHAMSAKEAGKRDYTLILAGHRYYESHCGGQISSAIKQAADELANKYGVNERDVDKAYEKLENMRDADRRAFCLRTMSQIENLKPAR